jgi:hypothetical protein
MHGAITYFVEMVLGQKILKEKIWIERKLVPQLDHDPAPPGLIARSCKLIGALLYLALSGCFHFSVPYSGKKGELVGIRVIYGGNLLSICLHQKRICSCG